MVPWTDKELEGTAFKPGWYEGEIQWRNKDEDTVGIFYREGEEGENGCVQTVCYTSNGGQHFKN